MNGPDQHKVIQAGITIIRRRDYTRVGSGEWQHEIIGKNMKAPNWVVLQKGFKSKAARDRVMVEMLKQPTIVED